jgi:hypothetical protein
MIQFLFLLEIMKLLSRNHVSVLLKNHADVNDDVHCYFKFSM